MSRDDLARELFLALYGPKAGKDWAASSCQTWRGPWLRVADKAIEALAMKAEQSA